MFVRACLGNMIVFKSKSGSKRRFSRATGINCHHVYMAESRQLQLLNQPFAEQVANITAANGVTFLFTLLPNGILDGTCGQPGANCAAESPYLLR